MAKKQYNTLYLSWFSLCLSMALSGCGSARIESSWRSQAILVDGKYSDWGGMTSYYDENQKTVVNLLNDRDYLYICLITRNRELEVKLMESGLVAWFDPENKKRKTFGIVFPVGFKKTGMSIEENKRDMATDWQDQEDKSGLIDRERERLRDKDFDKWLRALEELQDKLEIRSPRQRAKEDADKQKTAAETQARAEGFHKDKGKELSLEEAAKFGIEAKVGRENGYFVYELKVPLAKSARQPYAIGTTPAKTIAMGLETGEEPETGHMRRAQDGSGYGGIGRGMSQEEKVQLWATVTLASAE